MSAKKQAAASVTSLVKLWVPAGMASVSGNNLGPALGQRGVKAIDFCKQFNEATKNKFIAGTPMRVLITILPNRTFTFDVKSPTTAYLMLKAAQIDKGSGTPGHEVVAQLSVKHIYEVAKIKQTHDSQLQHVSLENVCSQVCGAARSLGIQIVA